MTILNTIFPRSSFQEIENYERIINRILKLEIPFSILKFSLTEHGIEIKLEVPNEKIALIREEFKKESIQIKNQIVEVDDDLCINCGECISLCNTGALYFDEECIRKFDENKCVGCKLCTDACPREAIVFK